MTVSRALNRTAFVSTEIAERVDAAVQALGYVPNLAARNLAGGQHCRLALLYSNPSAAYLSEFLMGCLDAAAVGGAQLVVEKHEHGETLAGLIERLRTHRIDAVVLPPPLCDESALVEALLASDWLVAQVATGAPEPHCASVAIDDTLAAEAITRHVIALGHRAVGFISGAPNQTVTGQRLAGYRRALEAAGLAPDPALIAYGDFTYRSGMAAAERLLALPSRPTAILASNDDMAAGAIAAAHRLGLSVPGDLSVAGYDDTAMATSIWPELTTIRQPVAEMARQAVHLLIEATAARLIGEPLAPIQRQLAFELIERASVAPRRRLPTPTDSPS
jgi:LacI family transcriptional regulator